LRGPRKVDFLRSHFEQADKIVGFFENGSLQKVRGALPQCHRDRNPPYDNEHRTQSGIRHCLVLRELALLLDCESGRMPTADSILSIVSAFVLDENAGPLPSLSTPDRESTDPRSPKCFLSLRHRRSQHPFPMKCARETASTPLEPPGAHSLPSARRTKRTRYSRCHRAVRIGCPSDPERPWLALSEPRQLASGAAVFERA
jgi:hypothetical protein